MKISNEFKNKEPIIRSGTHRQQWHKIKINMCISATDTRTHELKVEYIKKTLLPCKIKLYDFNNYFFNYLQII